MKSKGLKVLAAYGLTSYYFLKNPEIIHDCKQRRLALPKLEEGCSHYVIAHRGGTMENPENTLQAFQHAISRECGAHMLETDVRMSKDGVIVVCHDDSFHRMCGPGSTDSLTKDLNFSEFPLFRDHLPMHFSKNQLYPMRESDQRQFSTLEEVFKGLPKEAVLQIELKDRHSKEAQMELVRLIQKYDRQKTTVIGTEREAETLELHQLDPSIPKFVSGDALMKYLLCYYTGLLPFMRIDHHEVFALPYMTRDYLRMKLIEAREKTPLYYLFIVVTTIANKTLNGMLVHLVKRGKHTSYWVINDDDEILKVIQSSPIQGVMTDRPTGVKKVIEEETRRMKQSIM